ncbi:amidase family protein [mine drainage metagenome]|uniref:Amidase family protein n=1 Tax=mine drainage metagenome TaxID=410659 RepID=T1DAG6_9ZZZZ
MKIALFISFALSGLLTTTQAHPQSAPLTGPVTPYFQSVATLHRELESGRVTDPELVRAWIERIRLLNRQGPRLHAVILINPDAIRIARERERQIRSGHGHGLLFGIPVLLKDNIDTRPMPTTAGSLALEGPPPSRNATIVTRLEKAGAIILGKANLSEWANFRSTHSTSGWSAVGGLTRNPYVLSRSACGSSSGSAVAVSAGLVPLAIGTETDGSLTCPASMNGVVDIKPTLGLVSRAGIVPIAASQDDPGPMARSVADAAALLTVIAGSDPRDPWTRHANRHVTDYTRYLKPGQLKGRRIGVVCGLVGADPQVRRILDYSVAALRSHGAQVIAVRLPHLHDYEKAEFTTLLYEFKNDLNAYLSHRHGLKVKTLSQLITFDERHAREEMPWFGQDIFLMADRMGPLTTPAYQKALARAKRLTGSQGIDAALKAHHLVALMAPASCPAWSIDLVDGDHGCAGGDSPAAVAGYPSITVPAGNVHGLPVGMTFFSGKWTEPTLITIGYDFEQATKQRIRPHFLPKAPVQETVPTEAQLERDAPPALTVPPTPVCPIK